MKLSLLTTLLFLSLAGVEASAADAPWQQHGKIAASPNGHALQHADGTPFLWMGDTAWGLFQQLTREESRPLSR